MLALSNLVPSGPKQESGRDGKEISLKGFVYPSPDISKEKKEVQDSLRGGGLRT